MKRRNWIALTAIAVVGIVLCTVIWVVYMGRDEPPGATGSIPGQEIPALGTPVTPETPGR